MPYQFIVVDRDSPCRYMYRERENRILLTTRPAGHRHLKEPFPETLCFQTGHEYGEESGSPFYCRDTIPSAPRGRRPSVAAAFPPRGAPPVRPLSLIHISEPTRLGM